MLPPMRTPYRAPKLLFLSLLLPACLSVPLHAGSLLLKKTDNLARQLLALTPQKEIKLRVAVIPLHAAGRNGAAIGTLIPDQLIGSLSRTGRAHMIERTQIENILREQKFQMTGAVDNNTAVKIGNLLGAEALVLGSAAKAGRHYQINTRLVDTESGAILATAYEEIPAEEFEADPHFQRAGLWDKGSLAIYGFYFRATGVDKAGAFTRPAIFVGTHTVVATSDVTPLDFDFGGAGIGVRYYPWNRIFVDISYMKPRSADVAQPINGFYPKSQLTDGRVVTVLAGKAYPMSPKTALRASAGATYYEMEFESVIIKPEMKTFAPIVQAAFEWRPQQRIGFSLAVNVALRKLEIATTTGESIAEISPISIQPSVSLNF